jgi:hypothetical protein
MSNRQRVAALKAWRDILLQPDQLGGAEDRYNELLRSADDMEKANLIGSNEWRRTVQEAGAALALSADSKEDGGRSKSQAKKSPRWGVAGLKG